MATYDQVKEVGEITALRTYYETNLYQKVRIQQKTDDTYIKDTFEVPEIAEPHQLYRSGIGDRIVNAPAEHIITSNPQVFFHPRKDTQGAKQSALKLSELVNAHWLPLLQKQNPNIFKEFIKNLLGRGEAFFKVVNNGTWETDKANTLPANIQVIDSMVVYASPEESMEGVPVRVVVWYQITQYKDLIPRYPFLADVRPNNELNNFVDWIEYYDKGKRYIAAGETPVTKGGVQANVLGFTPFVRKYSGFGRRSPDGELADLIVSDIRRSRDLVREECATRSNIASIEYLFAHSPWTFIGRGLTADMLRDSISLGTYDINAIDAEPDTIKIEKLEITPSPETYQHHQNIINELNMRHPFILAGLPWGSSGRQQDMTEISGMRRYDSIVESTEHAFATAIKMALRICLLPGYMPDGVTRKDLETEFDVEVKLKAKDPIAEERRITMGQRLWNGGQGSISLRKLHVDYQGMTEDESNREVARMLADQVTILNPDVAEVLGMVAAEESGLESWLEKAKARRENMEQLPGIRDKLSASSQERMGGEIETPSGFEESNRRGARRPPSGFERGG